MEISHGFGYRAHDLKGLFSNTNKISTFMNKLEKQSLIDPKRYDSGKYKGDGFEFLIEILCKSHAYDNRLGITDYTPVQSGDNGVDGVGINLSGNKCVVQVKYRSNNNSLLTANQDHLSNMFSDAQTNHGVSSTLSEGKMLEEYKEKGIITEKNFQKRMNELSTSAPRHYVITTANGLHHYTDSENFKGYVHCIGYEQLRSMLDNNLSFWNLCRKISEEISQKISVSK